MDGDGTLDNREQDNLCFDLIYGVTTLTPWTSTRRSRPSVCSPRRPSSRPLPVVWWPISTRAWMGRSPIEVQGPCTEDWASGTRKCSCVCPPAGGGFRRDPHCPSRAARPTIGSCHVLACPGSLRRSRPCYGHRPRLFGRVVGAGSFGLGGVRACGGWRAGLPRGRALVARLVVWEVRPCGQEGAVRAAMLRSASAKHPILGLRARALMGAAWPRTPPHKASVCATHFSRSHWRAPRRCRSCAPSWQ